MRTLRLCAVLSRSIQPTRRVRRSSISVCDFPADERFGLTAHLRKTATFVPSNIAEGCGRHGEKELCRFLSIAAGSASELEYQLLLAHDLDYLSRDAYVALNEQVVEVKRTLYRFMQSLNSTT
jgi:four helix bundle protein